MDNYIQFMLLIVNTTSWFPKPYRLFLVGGSLTASKIRSWSSTVNSFLPVDWSTRASSASYFSCNCKYNFVTNIYSIYNLYNVKYKNIFKRFTIILRDLLSTHVYETEPSSSVCSTACVRRNTSTYVGSRLWFLAWNYIYTNKQCVYMIK